MFLPHPCVKVNIVGSLRDREVACSASDSQGSNFESCIWRTVSSQSSHHPQEVLLAQFSLYVHKGGLKPDSFHFHSQRFIIVGSLRDREVVCSASDLQELTFEFRVWRAVSSHSSHYLTIIRFSWPSLAYMCTKVAQSPIHFTSFLFGCLKKWEILICCEFGNAVAIHIKRKYNLLVFRLMIDR